MRECDIRRPRIDVRRAAVLTNSDGVEIPVTLLDISSGGFRIKVFEPLQIGELVKLRADKDGEYLARIRWALGNEAGAEFHEGGGLGTGSEHG